ncbi:MAG TPA: pirin family protein [Polyangiaceae bacterium]|nr:pirin family protein [Polyangiaceae bacterium]
MDRRTALHALLGTPLLAACRSSEAPKRTAMNTSPIAVPDVVRSVQPLGFPWQTLDPFLFCVYHDDAYPAGNAQLGPAASLRGRNIGQDFAANEPWRMYHGQVVPGFPQHPHRGFETVTVVRRGLVDHADSLGAAARYGGGDVQWLTAGRGIVHAEMFPLLDAAAPNPLELFQIWLNLPSTNKMVEPHFSMLWRQTIKKHAALDNAGRTTEVSVIAGKLGPVQAPEPPPKSWAARASSDVAIWTLKMAPGAQFSLPPAAAGSNRMLYFFSGKELRVGQRPVQVRNAIELHADLETPLYNGPVESELLMLQGRPIGEPVVQYGPFVMNTQTEIQKAFTDYRATQFGGWPWPKDDPVHDREARFAKHADGRLEKAS